VTNTSTAVNDAVRAIVAKMRARSGYRSCWSSGSGVPVYHSAEAGLMDEQVTRALIIADLGDPSVPQEAGDSQQGVATLGTLHHRDEEAVVRCRSIAVTGDVHDGAVQATWDAAHTTVDDLDAELRADPSLGLVPAYSHLIAMVGAVTGVRPYLGAGVVVEVLFDVRVEARI
jgi:hypothetical protein